MIYRVFSVFDNKVGAFLPPIFLRSKGEAVRVFSNAVAEKDHMFRQHPEDYTLFELATWSDDSAAFELLPAPLSVITGVEAVPRE